MDSRCLGGKHGLTQLAADPPARTTHKQQLERELSWGGFDIDELRVDLERERLANASFPFDDECTPRDFTLVDQQ